MARPFGNDEKRAPTEAEAVKAVVARVENLNSCQALWRKSLVEVRDYLLPDHGAGLDMGLKSNYLQFSNAERKDEKIYNNSPTTFLTRTVKGVYSGLVSPGLPWFNLTINGVDKLEPSEADKSKMDLVDQIEERVYIELATSNFYDVAYQFLLEVFGFGVGCIGMFKDDEGVYFQHLTAGEYAYQTDKRGKVNAIYRLIFMSVQTMVDEFGYDKVSDKVKRAYDSRKTLKKTEMVAVWHIVEESEQDDLIAPDIQKKFRSFYIERDNPTCVLKINGFDVFPYVVSRLKVIAGNEYAYGFGRSAMADIKMLQVEEEQLAHARETTVNPPMQGPGSLLSRGVDISPGAFNVIDAYNGGNDLLRPVFQATPNVSDARMSIREVEQRIKETFMTDVFAPFSEPVKTHVSATEISIRQQQNLQLAGPEVYALVASFLKPVVDYMQEYVLMSGQVEIGEDFKESATDIEFVAPLMVQLRSIVNDNIQRYLLSMTQLMQANPESASEIKDTIDWLKTARIMATNLSVPSNVMASNETVQKKRAERQSQQALANAQGESQIATNLADAVATVGKAGML